MHAIVDSHDFMVGVRDAILMVAQALGRGFSVWPRAESSESCCILCVCVRLLCFYYRGLNNYLYYFGGSLL